MATGKPSEADTPEVDYDEEAVAKRKKKLAKKGPQTAGLINLTEVTDPTLALGWF